MILLCTKFLGLFYPEAFRCRRWWVRCGGRHSGPAALNILHETNFIKQVAELGVIILMFNAGLETNITELRKAGKASFIIALIGVLVPLAGGFVVAYFFTAATCSRATPARSCRICSSASILTATSVSITVKRSRSWASWTPRGQRHSSARP